MEEYLETCFEGPDQQSPTQLWEAIQHKTQGTTFYREDREAREGSRRDHFCFEG
jgi:hypothetical protein